MLLVAALLVITGRFVSWILFTSGLAFSGYVLYDWYCVTGGRSALEVLTKDKNKKQ